jgi:hypothetical protein
MEVEHQTHPSLRFPEGVQFLSQQENVKIAAAEGRFGVLSPDIEAVSTTFRAGEEAIRRGIGRSSDSFAPVAAIRPGQGTDNRSPYGMDLSRADRFHDHPECGEAKQGWDKIDTFIQLMKPKNTLRWMRGEDPVTHPGLEYYE